VTRSLASLSVALSLAACAKPYLATREWQERIDIAHCDEDDRAKIGRYLDDRKWLDEARWYLHKIPEDSLHVRYAFEESLLVVDMRVRLDPENSWGAGSVFESVVQDIQTRSFECRLRVFAKSLPSSDTARMPALATPGQDHFDADSTREAWFAEIESPRPSPNIPRTFRDHRGSWFYPRADDFERRYRQAPDIVLALFFETRPVVHPVFHTLIFREREGRYEAVYALFKDSQFLWKARLELDSSRFGAIRKEIDFMAKANTYVLGRSDYIDPRVQSRCMEELGMEKAGQDAEVRRIRDKCLAYYSHAGVFLDRHGPAPIYLYGIRNLAEERDRRILDDFMIKAIRNILKELPAGEVTWER
jgi:hypothetical protein